MPTNNDKDRTLREWIRKAIVPRGLRPQHPEDLEALLDTVGGEVLQEEQVQRILQKAKGQLPVGVRQQLADTAEAEAAMPEQARELLALHRKAKGELPPEVQRKLEGLRNRVAQQNEDKTDERIQ